MAVRGQFAGAFSGSAGALFAIELLLAIVPLVLLSSASLRARRSTLFAGALLATLGIILNRVNVVLFAMQLKGAMPQVSPETYMPSIVEWGISIGLIAAAILLFNVGVRMMPVLPKDRTAPGAGA
jgi:formate dehydrogenase iron-sulfur subunit